MKLNTQSIVSEKALWQEKGFILPLYDTDMIKRNTEKAPRWVHFGGGNIFRGYIARLADDLICQGDMDSGIIAADSFDTETIDKIYDPYDDLSLLVGLPARGEKYLRVIGSIGGAVCAKGEGMTKLRTIAKSDSLQMISYTITEKGYAVKDMNGDILPYVQADIDDGMSGELRSAMSVTAALMYERFCAGGTPVALVSMDNCSRNGEKLKESVLTIAEGWCRRGFCGADFVEWLKSPKVSFPWSMIDKITPRPDSTICGELTALGVEGMSPVKTSRGTFTAPFVNAEMPEYLVIEDDFPNGRPPLEKAGVYMTDRESVDRAEKMKVMTCLNPLHTALAVFGCLLGYKKISEEMEDSDLKALVYRLGYKEGLPVVIDPHMISPENFLREVLEERLPNSCLPDTPQRIAADTSQKLAIRFGGTVRAYAEKGSASKLEMIPLVIAAWLRYLTAVGDDGAPMELSADPMLDEMQKTVRPEWFGKGCDRAAVEAVLKNEALFGADLVSVGLADKIAAYLDKMLAGAGAVRKVLHDAVTAESR